LKDNRSICYQRYFDSDFKSLAWECFHENFALKHGPFRRFEKDYIANKVWLKQTGYYKLNKAVGPWVDYNIDGSVAAVNYYFDGQKVEPNIYKQYRNNDKSIPPMECYQTYDWLTVHRPDIEDDPELITMGDFKNYGANFPDKYGLTKKLRDKNILYKPGESGENLVNNEKIFSDGNIKQAIGERYMRISPKGVNISTITIKYGPLRLYKHFNNDGTPEKMYFRISKDLHASFPFGAKSSHLIGPYLKNINGTYNMEYHNGNGNVISKQEYESLYENNNMLPNPGFWSQSGATNNPGYVDYPTQKKPGINTDLVDISKDAKIWDAKITDKEFTIELIEGHNKHGAMRWTDFEQKVPKSFYWTRGFYYVNKTWYPNKQLRSFGINPDIGAKYKIDYNDDGSVKREAGTMKNISIYKRYVPEFVYPEPSGTSMINSVPSQIEIPKAEITPLFLAYIKALDNPASQTGIDQLIVSQTEGEGSQSQGNEDNSYQTLQRQEMFILLEKVNDKLNAATKSFEKPYWEDNNSATTTITATNPKQESLNIILQAVQIAKQAKYPENEAGINYLIANKLIQFSGRVFGYQAKQDFFMEATKLINRSDQLIPQLNHVKSKSELSDYYCSSGEIWREMTRKAQWGNHAYNKMACDKKVKQQYERALQIDPNNQKARRILDKLKAPKEAIPEVVEQFKPITNKRWNNAQDQRLRMFEEEDIVVVKKPEINALQIAEMTLEYLEGTVSIKRSGTENWKIVNDSRIQLFTGDKIKTSSDAKGVSITYNSDKAFLAILNSAEVEIADENTLMIRRGKGCVQVNKKGSEFLVITPTCAVGVRGTMFEVDVKPDKTTETYLFEGVIETRNGNDIAYLVPGQKLIAKKGEEKLIQSSFNAQQRLSTQWHGFEQQKNNHEQIVNTNNSHNPNNNTTTIKTENNSFAELWNIDTYDTNIESFKESVTAKTNNGFVPVGLNCTNSQHEVLYLGGGVLTISAWNMEWYNDANGLQQGINRNMNEGYIPTGFSWNGSAYYIFYVKTDFTGQAWQIVPSALDLNEVSSAIQPFVEQNYTPMGITVFENEYYTLLVQFTDPLANQWQIEGCNDNLTEITNNVNKKLPEAIVPWGILKSGGVANILYIGM